MTSYDILWTEFITNCKTEDINLPNTPSKIHDVIHSAIRKYNNRMKDDVSWDDVEEVVDRELNNDNLLIIANYIRWACLRNQYSFFVMSYQPFQSEIGLRNFKSQVDGLKELINKAEADIEKIIQYSADDIV